MVTSAEPGKAGRTDSLCLPAIGTRQPLIVSGTGTSGRCGAHGAKCSQTISAAP